MYVLVAVSGAVIPLAIISHGHPHPHVAGLLSGVQGGLSSNSVLLIIALAGTTVAPWQLFFQQSNVVDKRITPRWIVYERIDTLAGTLVVILGAVAVMLACAWAFAGTPLHGAYHDAGAVAAGLRINISPFAGTLFAIALLDASILGAAAVSPSSSYAIGDYFGYRHSLHRPVRQARFFHGSYAASIALAAIVVLIPGAPLGLITTGVQALAGVLLPSATVFLLLLCNDREVLGPWTNPRWLNALAAVVVGGLVALSMTLTITTLFPSVNVARLCLIVFGTLGGALAVGGAICMRPGETLSSVYSRWDRDNWTMPPLETLPAPQHSRARRLMLTALRAQLVIAVTLLLVKLTRLAVGA